MSRWLFRLALGWLALSLSGVPGAAVLPPGFEETTAAWGLPNPTSIAFAPDGNLWILLGDGRVFLRRDGSPVQMADLNVDAQGEHGAVGLEIDPDYLTNRHVWIYYTAAYPIRNRVSRFTHVEDVLKDEVVMIRGPMLDTVFHTGGCLRFDSAKNLYVTMGDDAQGSATAQNPFDLRGKILRVDRTGAAVPGNPYFDGTAGDPRVYAIGLRNPFRCNVQPGSDALFVGDVGNASYEEISIAFPGANLGWATVEGPHPPGLPGFVYPIHWYDHSEADSACVIGGDHAAPGDFAPEYEGDYFFGDWALNRISRMRLDASNRPISTEVWATETRAPSDIRFGPDGALYYASQNASSVKRIAYVGGANRQPVARATASPDAGLAPLAVRLDGTASYDPDQDALTYSWDLGDGASSTSAVVDHTYAQGVHHAALTVQDGQGGSSTTPRIRIVSGNRRPQAGISQPGDESRYDAGQTITYSGTGTDAEDGSLPCSRFSWSVLFHHADHAHPYLGPLEGVCTGTFVIADTGEASADTWYEILLDVDDSGAPLGTDAILTGSHSVEIRPNTVTMLFETVPLPDLQLTLDTQPFTPPRTEPGVVNFVRRIGAVDAQLRGDGHTYRWLSWSDGGAREHDIRTPAADTLYRATFGCDVLVVVPGLRVTKAGQGQISLSWAPPPDTCLSDGEERYRIYAAATADPVSPPGSFPDDPPFKLVGTSTQPTFTFAPGPAQNYFVVVAVGSDGGEGPAGHY